MIKSFQSVKRRLEKMKPEQMQPVVEYNEKETYRLWFEFLKRSEHYRSLCDKMNEYNIEPNLNKEARNSPIKTLFRRNKDGKNLFEVMTKREKILLDIYYWTWGDIFQENRTYVKTNKNHKLIINEHGEPVLTEKDTFQDCWEDVKCLKLFPYDMMSAMREEYYKKPGNSSVMLAQNDKTYSPDEIQGKKRIAFYIDLEADADQLKKDFSNCIKSINPNRKEIPLKERQRHFPNLCCNPFPDDKITFWRTKLKMFDLSNDDNLTSTEIAKKIPVVQYTERKKKEVQYDEKAVRDILKEVKKTIENVEGGIFPGPQT